ncbi:hypothetical protein FACS1894139_04580 [Planctomycetales bacterium]|nr:hypothetical protein FACS1894107_09140 [Planctomycetales bacterium]GHS99051.1 hypothetical protein FACS1894108_08320 [Planctomycetales bacterium]GHT03690.1 hypothetical protein FACS1894139_04580 [Planctomycetales bacterium]
MQKLFISGVFVGVLFLAVAPVARAMTVFDPSNYAVNAQTAARELEQINNQVKQYNEMIQEYQAYMKQWETMLKNPFGVGDTLGDLSQIKQNLMQMKDNITGVQQQIQGQMQQLQGFIDQVKNFQFQGGDSIDEFQKNSEQMQAHFNSVQQQFDATCETTARQFEEKAQKLGEDADEIANNQADNTKKGEDALEAARTRANSQPDSVTAQTAANTEAIIAAAKVNNANAQSQTEMGKAIVTAVIQQTEVIQNNRAEDQKKAREIGAMSNQDMEKSKQIREKIALPEQEPTPPPASHKPSGLGRTRDHLRTH